MKQLKMTAFLTAVIFLTACSFGYNVVIVNDSDELLEVHYKITEKGAFNELLLKSLEDWNAQKSIRRYWTEEKSWRSLPETEFSTDSEKHERIVKIAPRQVIQIETGHYNPISEERGDLTEIAELKIVSPNGEISYKGKLLLNQFEKDGYTFIKTYKNKLKDRDFK